MIPRPLLTVLVFAIPILVVAFAVLMGGAALAGATGDAGAEIVLRWVAIGVLLLAAADLILLIGALGVRALAESDPADRRPSNDHGHDSLES